MKTKLLGLLMITFLTGCAMNQTQQVITNISARRVGCEIGQSGEGKAQKYLNICNDILSLEDELAISDIFERFIIDVLSDIDDPLLAKDLEDLLMLFGADISIPGLPDIEEVSVANLKYIAEQFKYGIEVCSSGG